MSDIEITHKIEMQPIMEIGARIDVRSNPIIRYGPHKSNLTYEYIEGDVGDVF